MRRANDTAYGLAGAVFTKDLSRAIRVSQEVFSFASVFLCLSEPACGLPVSWRWCSCDDSVCTLCTHTLAALLVTAVPFFASLPLAGELGVVQEVWVLSRRPACCGGHRLSRESHCEAKGTGTCWLLRPTLFHQRIPTSTHVHTHARTHARTHTRTHTR